MPRFALLEHSWNGLHWDFFLERTEGGPLATWAVNSPIVVSQTLPARALDDHRAIYLEYEGDVSGNRGTVRRLDRGNYDVELWTPRHIRVRIQGAQLVGLVELSDEPDLGWIFRLGNLD